MHRSYTCALVLVGASLLPVASAETGDETLQHYLEHSELVVDATVKRVGPAISYEVGVVLYSTTVEVNRTLKGDPAPEGPLDTSIVRREVTKDDRLPYLKEGARVVLFLKQVGDEKTRYETADVWFGVQPYSRPLADRLARLWEHERKQAEPVQIAYSLSSHPKAMETVFRLLREADIWSIGVSNAGGDVAYVQRRDVARARTLLRDALESEEAKQARKEQEGPPEAWDFKLMED